LKLYNNPVANKGKTRMVGNLPMQFIS